MADNQDQGSGKKRVFGVPAPSFGKQSWPLAVVLVGAVGIGGWVLISDEGEEVADLSTVPQTRDLDNTPGGAVERSNPSLQRALASQERTDYAQSVREGESFVPSRVAPAEEVKSFAEQERANPQPKVDELKGVEAFLAQSAKDNAVADDALPGANENVASGVITNRNNNRAQTQEPQYTTLEQAQRNELKAMINAMGPRSYTMKESGFTHAYQGKANAEPEADQQSRDGAGGSYRRGVPASASYTATAASVSPAASTDAEAAPTTSGSKPLKGVQWGDVVYATMFNTASTDAPSNIIAKTHTGPFLNGTVFGSFTEGRKSLVLKFTRLQLSDGRQCTFKALAVDLATAKSSVVSNYDGRWWQTTLPLAAAAFVETFMNGIAAPSKTIITSEFGTVTEVTDAPTTEEALASGAAAIGGELANSARRKAAETKPLIEVEAGTEFGLILEDTPTCRAQD